MKKNLKRKLLAATLAAVLCLGSAIPAGLGWVPDFGMLSEDSSVVYADTGHWSDPYMNKLISQGVLKGDKNGNLKPESGITRAEFITMINRSFGYKNKSGKGANFADVDKTAWYADDIAIAANQGYFEGVGSGQAMPESILKREEAVTLLCRALKIEGITEDNYSFVDSRDFSYWSKEFIYAATEKEYINGYPDQTFRPTSTMKRGEMSRVLADAAGDIVQNKGDASVGYTSGNVTLNTSGTILKDTTVPGDVYITGGLDLGYTGLENVTVLGDVIISGTGESNAGDNSVVMRNCSIRNMIVDSSNGKKMTIRAEGSTTIEKTVIKSPTYLEEGNIKTSAFKDIELNGPSGTQLDLAGIFENVTVAGEKNKLSLLKGYIARLQVDETSNGASIFLEKDTESEDVFLDAATTITGTGKINNIVIAVNGCNISMLPKNIIIRPGITATVNGKSMTSTDAELNALTPKIESGPTFTNRLPTSIDATLKVNKPGKVYWMVKKRGEPAPTLAQLMTPKASDGVKYANISAVNDKDTVLKLTGLVAAGEYDLYTVLVDIGNKNSSVGKSSFNTEDNVIPQFLGGTPKLTEGATSAAIIYTSSKDGTVHWAITEPNATAPTAADLINSGSYMPGKIMRSSQSGPKTTEQAISTKDYGTLEEAKQYVFYAVIKDYADNISSVSRIPFGTTDVTAPEFSPSYPTFNSTAPTSLTMKYRTNEPATVYYAVFVAGSPFPNPASKPNDPEMLTTKSSIQAVINGNIGVKSGKVTSNGTADASTIISGLEAKKMYDVYLVLEDTSKNKNASSKVYQYKDNILVDRDTPIAKVTYLPDYDGRPKVTSKITMTFDKVMVDTVTNKRLAELVKTSDAALNENIKLYDREPADPVGKEVPISFKAQNTRVEEKNSQTVVTFNLTPQDVSFKLASGNKYQFELRNLADTSGNLISPTEVVRLEEFMTVPPQINLNSNAGSDVKFDLVIEMEPQDFNVASNKRYDTIIKSNANATFNIYSLTGSGVLTSDTAIKVKENAQTDKGKSYSLTDLIAGPVNAGKFEEFDKFRENRLYGIEFTTLEGNTNKESWNQMVSFEVQGLIGSGESLYKIAAAPKIFAPIDPLLIKENVQIVSEPISKAYEKPFMDSVVPQFIRNTPTVAAIGDSAVQLDIMLDAPASLSWLLAEKGKIAKAPTAQQIRMGQPLTEGGQAGNQEITAPNALTSLKIENMKPTTAYELYMTPKGSPADSIVTMAAFTTTAVSQPVIDEFKQVNVGKEKVDASVRMLNSNAKVYWMAFPREEIKITPNAIDIIERTNIVGSKAVSYGDFDAKVGETTQFEITKLKEEQYYNVYATALNPYNSSPAEVKSLMNITSADTIPPSIKSFSTAIDAITSSGGISKYSGELSVIFNEFLYYLDENSEAQPLTKDILTRDLGDANFVINPRGLPNFDGAISNLTITFTDMVLNKERAFSYEICDKSNNNVGRLIFTLKATGNAETPIAWDVRFTKVPLK